ncbi:MAG: ubiquinol-cytochrome c reductase iron-sulfur subunit [Anaerolineales bacterium]|nr:ubiquinol-cytochrome c reductase iron-sulfur subunit [Anaerolineales bacterium]
MTQHRPKNNLTRRGFVTAVVGFLGSVISAFITLPGISYLISPGLKKSDTAFWMPLGPVDDLVEGIPKLYTFTKTKRIGWEATGISYGVYVIQKPSGELDVFSNVCTHLSCRYTFREDLDHFFCACHGGHFAKDGAVLAGPPPRPLDRYEHKVEDGIISVHIV